MQDTNLGEKKNPNIKVLALIDWNSQIHLNDNPKLISINLMKRVLERTANRIARYLVRTQESSRFTVNMRLYHGWHRGYEPSSNRKAVKSAISELDFATLSGVPAVRFLETIGYGDRLIAALPNRLHKRIDVHLPNTLRRLDRKDCEKMVDTAIAADLLITAVTEPNDWIIVVGEDDDLIPPIFTAEAVLQYKQGRVILLHSCRRRGAFLKLDELAVRQG